MTKKHFILIADELKRTRDHFICYHGEMAFRDMVQTTVRFCRDANSRFNERTFCDYVAGLCGPSGGKL